MPTALAILSIAALLLIIPGQALCKTLTSNQTDISLQKEVDRTKVNGFAYLKKTQNPDGSWSNPDFPALTGLVLVAFFTAPDYDKSAPRPAHIQRGLDFIIGNAKENGAIFKEKLPNYNTAISILALTASGDPAYNPYILKARSYVASLQEDRGSKGQADDPYDGGVGYGTKDHSDMSNTYMALEALRLSEYLESDQHMQLFEDLKGFEKKTLNWDAALKFIQRCQNLPTHNDQGWASDDPDNKGGFVYYPGSSKAGEQTLPDGKVALRSYGSMTYAGLLSFIYADLKKDDPRVTAAVEWIENNYTLDENPGLGQQGLYYYYHTMAKALNVLQVDHLTAKNGDRIDWRKELTSKLVEKQKGDGSWVNDSGRWWENDPVLVTAYSLIALNMIAI
jgi:squalene-hopene/tetraprenyl-beta-curcumene cyclase